MLQDTMESMDDDEIEEEAEEEVNKVLFQITDGNVCRILLRHLMYNFSALDTEADGLSYRLCFRYCRSFGRGSSCCWIIANRGGRGRGGASTGRHAETLGGSQELKREDSDNDSGFDGSYRFMLKGHQQQQRQRRAFDIIINNLPSK